MITTNSTFLVYSVDSLAGEKNATIERVIKYPHSVRNASHPRKVVILRRETSQERYYA